MQKKKKNDNDDDDSDEDENNINNVSDNEDVEEAEERMETSCNLILRQFELAFQMGEEEWSSKEYEISTVRNETHFVHTNVCGVCLSWSEREFVLLLVLIQKCTNIYILVFFFKYSTGKRK